MSFRTIKLTCYILVFLPILYSCKKDKEDVNPQPPRKVLSEDIFLNHFYYFDTESNVLFVAMLDYYTEVEQSGFVMKVTSEYNADLNSLPTIDDKIIISDSIKFDASITRFKAKVKLEKDSTYLIRAFVKQNGQYIYSSAMPVEKGYSTDFKLHNIFIEQSDKIPTKLSMKIQLDMSSDSGATPYFSDNLKVLLNEVQVTGYKIEEDWGYGKRLTVINFDIGNSNLSFPEKYSVKLEMGDQSLDAIVPIPAPRKLVPISEFLGLSYQNIIVGENGYYIFGGNLGSGSNFKENTTLYYINASNGQVSRLTENTVNFNKSFGMEYNNKVYFGNSSVFYYFDKSTNQIIDLNSSQTDMKLTYRYSYSTGQVVGDKFYFSHCSSPFYWSGNHYSINMNDNSWKKEAEYPYSGGNFEKIRSIKKGNSILYFNNSTIAEYNTVSKTWAKLYNIPDSYNVDDIKGVVEKNGTYYLFIFSCTNKYDDNSCIRNSGNYSLYKFDYSTKYLEKVYDLGRINDVNEIAEINGKVYVIVGNFYVSLYRLDWFDKI